MNRKIYYIALLGLLLIQQTLFSQSTFSQFSNTWIQDLWKLYPEWASSSGYFAYNHVMRIPDETYRNEQKEFARKNLQLLQQMNFTQLSISDRTDYYLIHDYLRSILWRIDTLKEYEWNAASYNVCSDFSYILQLEKIANETKLQSLSLRMNYVPAYYEQAKKNLKNPTAEHIQLAIKQNENSVSVFDKELPELIEKVVLPEEEKESMYLQCAQCKAAVLDYVRFLKNYKPATYRSFRLGNELYEQKYAYDMQSIYTVEEIYTQALQRKTYLHQQMYLITKKLWSDYFSNVAMPSDTLKAIRMMIDTLSVQHVKASEFQSSIEKHIPLLVDFVNKKQLLYLDPTKPLEVRKEPEYMAGVAGASISSPGPYDKEGKTYYNVGSLAAMNDAQKESYLREYNSYILQILNIHEAIPGHYTQGVYANQSPSMIKSILGNGTMIEGWAVYCELMMLENGYGNNTPEMWLMYYKWNLRSTCNTLLDIEVHTRNMNKEAAIELLTHQAFQQEAEAENKWNRVQLSSVQLCSYFTGFTEICALRESYKKEQESKYSLKNFHEQFLSYGSIPVKYIKALMLKKQ